MSYPCVLQLFLVGLSVHRFPSLVHKELSQELVNVSIVTCVVV